MQVGKCSFLHQWCQAGPREASAGETAERITVLKRSNETGASSMLPRSSGQPVSDPNAAATPPGTNGSAITAAAALLAKFRAMQAEIADLKERSMASSRPCSVEGPRFVDANFEPQSPGGTITALLSRIEPVMQENATLKARLKERSLRVAELEKMYASTQEGAQGASFSTACERNDETRHTWPSGAIAAPALFASDGSHESFEQFQGRLLSIGVEMPRLCVSPCDAPQGQKTLHHLYWEVRSGEQQIHIEGSQLCLITEIVRVYLLARISGEDRCLIEHDTFDLSNGRQKTVMLPLGARMPDGQDWRAAMRMALESQVGLSPQWQDQYLEVVESSYYLDEAREASREYPDVCLLSRTHEIQVRIKDEASEKIPSSARGSILTRAPSMTAMDSMQSMQSVASEGRSYANQYMRQSVGNNLYFTKQDCPGERIGLPVGRDFVTKEAREDGRMVLHVWCWKSREYEQNAKMRAFERYLEAHSVDVSSLGVGNSKTIFQFYQEVKEKRTCGLKEVVGEDGTISLTRQVTLLKIKLIAEINGRKRVLSETDQVLDDGRKRKANQLIVMKLRDNACWREEVPALIKKRLGLDTETQEECFVVDESRLEVIEESRPSKGYGGLPSNYKITTVTMHVSDPEHAELEKIGLPRGNEFVSQEGELFTNRGGKLHIWAWVPCMDEEENELHAFSGTALEELHRDFRAMEHLILQIASQPQMDGAGTEPLLKQALHKCRNGADKLANIDKTMAEVDIKEMINTGGNKRTSGAHLTSNLADFIATNFTRQPEKIIPSKNETPTDADKSQDDDDNPSCHMLPDSYSYSEFGLQMQEIKAGQDTWGFDFLGMDEKLNGRILECYSQVFVVPLCKSALRCSSEVAQAFVNAIVANYYDNPYHSAIHAAQVSHLATWLMRSIGVSEAQTEMERCAFILAAACHDLKHFGRNNAFCVNTEHNLALMYNNAKVLENMHAATAFELLAKVGAVTELQRTERARLRAHIIEYIFATDMAEHFEVISKFRVRREAGDFSTSSEEDRRFLARMCLKAGDIGHGALPWVLHQQWSVRVTQEFYEQGDQELQLGLPVSALCDRGTVNEIAKSQKGFLEFVCVPLYEVIADFQADRERQLEKQAAATELETALKIHSGASFNGSERESTAGGLHRSRSMRLPSNGSSATAGPLLREGTTARVSTRRSSAMSTILLKQSGITGNCIDEMRSNVEKWLSDTEAVTRVRKALESPTARDDAVLQESNGTT